MFAKNSKNWRVFMGETDITDSLVNPLPTPEPDDPAVDAVHLPPQSIEFSVSLEWALPTKIGVYQMDGGGYALVGTYADGSVERVPIRRIVLEGTRTGEPTVAVYLDSLPFWVNFLAGEIRGLPAVFRMED